MVGKWILSTFCWAPFRAEAVMSQTQCPNFIPESKTLHSVEAGWNHLICAKIVCWPSGYCCLFLWWTLKTDLKNHKNFTEVKCPQNTVFWHKSFINTFDKHFTINSKEIKPSQHLKRFQRPNTDQKIFAWGYYNFFAVFWLDNLLDGFCMCLKNVDQHIFMLESMWKGETPDANLATICPCNCIFKVWWKETACDWVLLFGQCVRFW